MKFITLFTMVIFSGCSNTPNVQIKNTYHTIKNINFCTSGDIIRCNVTLDNGENFIFNHMVKLQQKINLCYTEDNHKFKYECL